jgi:hypothetical protein
MYGISSSWKAAVNGLNLSLMNLRRGCTWHQRCLCLLNRCSVFVPGGQQGAAGADGDAVVSDDESSSDVDVQPADTAAADTAVAVQAAAADGVLDSGDDDAAQQASILFELTDVDVEVRLLPGSSSSSSGTVPVQVR